MRAHKNGRYYVARWRTSDGEPRSRSLGRVSRRQAEKLCWAMAAEFALEPGRRDAHNAPTLSEWHDRYPALRPELAPGTLALHDRTFRYLRQRFGDGTRLDQITPAKAHDWQLWLREQSGRGGAALSEQTVSGHVRNAKVILALAKRRRLVGSNPFDDVSGAAPKASKDWRKVTTDDLERILEACPNHAWRCAFALARLAGLRRGEALALRWGDIDFDRRRIRAWAEKTHEGREVPIAPRLAEILQAAYDDAPAGSEAVCAEIAHTDLHRRALSILKRSGVGAYAKPFHTLRKACENEWKLVAPWPTVCSWLGHSARVATEHYLRPEDHEYERVTTPTQRADPDAVGADAH